MRQIKAAPGIDGLINMEQPGATTYERSAKARIAVQIFSPTTLARMEGGKNHTWRRTAGLAIYKRRELITFRACPSPDQIPFRCQAREDIGAINLKHVRPLSGCHALRLWKPSAYQ